ncbi:MAG: ComF family protein [Nitrospirae bacterium]|nr:ComF family protein [Nitrospirota bacterium]
MSLFNRCLDLVFPQRCPVCLNSSDSFLTAPICSACWSSVRPVTGNLCNVCCRPILLKSDDTPPVVCEDCDSLKPSYASVLAFGLYDGVLREAIIKYKFSSLKRLSRPLSDLLCSMPIPHADLMVSVPLTKNRLIERGFNQTLLLAHHLSREYRINLLDDCLVKVRDTGHQVKLSRQQRLSALHNAFEVKSDVKGKRLLLIDDVLTTGATINECAKMLLRAGATEVFGIVLARTV